MRPHAFPFVSVSAVGELLACVHTSPWGAGTGADAGMCARAHAAWHHFLFAASNEMVALRDRAAGSLVHFSNLHHHLINIRLCARAAWGHFLFAATDEMVDLRDRAAASLVHFHAHVFVDPADVAGTTPAWKDFYARCADTFKDQKCALSISGFWGF